MYNNPNLYYTDDINQIVDDYYLISIIDKIDVEFFMDFEMFTPDKATKNTKMKDYNTTIMNIPYSCNLYNIDQYIMNILVKETVNFDRIFIPSM